MAACKSCCDKLVVAAIDFGTTYSGYAFSFKHDYEKEPTKVSSNNWTAGSRALVSLKTPTTLLLKPDKTFAAFGYEAEDRYADLALDEEHGKWYYFRRFKMMLFNKIVSQLVSIMRGSRGGDSGLDPPPPPPKQITKMLGPLCKNFLDPGMSIGQDKRKY